MPNHTTNILTIVGEKRIKPLLRPYLRVEKGEGTCLDLNKIVPMPKGILETLKFGDVKYIMRKRTKKQEELLRKEQEQKKDENQKKYGAGDWYEWSIQNWGTKWNTYSNQFFTKDTTPQKGDQALRFLTAWSPPEPALVVLSQKLGKIVRNICMDEGGAFYCVTHFHPNGEKEEEGYDQLQDVPDDLCQELCINTYEEEMLEQKEMEQEELARQEKHEKELVKK